MHSDDFYVNLYRLASNAELLSVSTGNLHALISQNPNRELTKTDLQMITNLTQGVLDYASTIIDKDITNE